ncbi:hypothetical protein GCM10007854_09490 [Algimonas porphyrae]|uniref:Uncharacterized protein n=1 Tax=Algimonas porphyrae TaxID=1128113 RepID=A0ABQ5UZY9_9PROT|nr:hypothetical protein GCM10007854_09490 [Algimonas porphyrae]
MIGPDTIIWATIIQVIIMAGIRTRRASMRETVIGSGWRLF